MRRLREWLVTAILVVVAIRVASWAIEPFIPYLVGALALVLIIGFIWSRSRRW